MTMESEAGKLSSRAAFGSSKSSGQARHASKEGKPHVKKDAAQRRTHKHAHRQVHKQGSHHGTSHGNSEGIDAQDMADTAAVSINSLKARTRQLSRHLAHQHDLGADSRQDKERELQSLQQTLAEALTRRERRGVLSKYHMVRFFERQKAMRNLRKLSKSTAEDDGSQGSPEQQAARQNAELDLLYTTHAPLGDKYISLFPKQAGADQAAPKPAVWHLVQRAQADGSLETVRDGTHPDLDALGLGYRVALAAKSQELQTKTAGMAHSSVKEEKTGAAKLETRTPRQSGDQGVPKNRAARRREERERMQAHAREEDDSDGGFFET